MIDITWDNIDKSRDSLVESSILMSSWQSISAEPWNEAERKLLTLRRLDDDWDDLGAIAPKPELVDSVLELVRELRVSNPDLPPDRVLAGPIGEIIIEWQTSEGILEIEIEQPGIAEVTVARSGAPTSTTILFFGETEERGASWGSPLADDLFKVA